MEPLGLPGNAPNPDRLTASLADTSGRIVAAATMEDGTTAINVAQLPEGIYIATLKSDKELILSEKMTASSLPTACSSFGLRRK